MTGDRAKRDFRSKRALVVALFRWHAIAYGVLMGGLGVANVFMGGGWWSFWPMCIWGLVLAVHFLYYKAVTVDEQWAQARTDDLKLRSYDLSHIEDIAGRVDDDDASVRPTDRRRRRD